MRYMHCLLLGISVTAFAHISVCLQAQDGITADKQSCQSPVALVQTGSGGVFPVSRNGILLPNEGLKAQDVSQYLQIDIGGLDPVGRVGAKYGYKAVTDAARIAVVLEDVWRDARLTAIVVSEPGAKTPHEYILEPGRNGIRVLWGHAPGSEKKGEATAADKVEQLKRFVDENSPEYTFLPSHSTVLDLRSEKGRLIKDIDEP